MPASSNHFTVLFHAKILCTNILTVPELTLI